MGVSVSLSVIRGGKAEKRGEEKTWHFVSTGCQREEEMKEEVIFGQKVVDESSFVFCWIFRVSLLQPYVLI